MNHPWTKGFREDALLSLLDRCTISNERSRSDAILVGETQSKTKSRSVSQNGVLVSCPPLVDICAALCIDVLKENCIPQVDYRKHWSGSIKYFFQRSHSDVNTQAHPHHNHKDVKDVRLPAVCFGFSWRQEEIREEQISHSIARRPAYPPFILSHYPLELKGLSTIF